MDAVGNGPGLDCLVAALSARAAASATGSWSVGSDEAARLAGIDLVTFWRELNGLRQRICFGEAIDGFTQDTVGDLVTVLECLVGDGAEEALRRAGLFLPYGPGAELAAQLLHAARSFSASHDVRADEFLGMLRHAGSVRAAIDIYLGEYADPDALVDSCAESFRATQGLPGVGAVTAARYLRRLFDRHVLDRRGLFTLLEDRLRLAAAQAGRVDPGERDTADEAGRAGRARTDRTRTDRTRTDRAGDGTPKARQGGRRAWALKVMGFAGGRDAAAGEPDPDDLRGRYRQLMMRLHPDVDPSGLERCKDVNVAYALLIAGAGGDV